ncbi:MAG: glucans biosynthesis glucosyltransferase MdoH [Candidatus Methylacidiphilales bacterium]|nr:glucans biosynthesis glucosyltransferase MdoH [Candidatus Methylacidiphilales bacterium]
MSSKRYHHLLNITAETLSTRRAVFLGLAGIVTLAGSTLAVQSLGKEGWLWSEWLALPIFVLLFAQLATGWAISILGFAGLISRKPYNILDVAKIAEEAGAAGGAPKQLPPTALLFPVYNENMDRVIAGIEKMWQSLEKTGSAASFDVFILSDSNKADAWVAEEWAWFRFCSKWNAFGRVFYRHRHPNIHGKSGNIADFCRNWGQGYRYMIVFDADSIISGREMVRLVQAMEAKPSIGIIQTLPRLVLGTTLFRRFLQFTTSIAGGLFATGTNYWQLSCGSYWGHNAIVRVAPFMAFCDLPELPATAGKSHILSHDTVEAALMRKAGYEVWIACDAEESYEEGPPHLTDALKRDRRWCQGNLQHIWFLFARDINFANRLHIFFGLMGYLGSPLWLVLLILTWISGAMRVSGNPFLDGLRDEIVDRPVAPAWQLLGLTLVLLFMPKVISFIVHLDDSRKFGGFIRMSISWFADAFLSMLFAPVLMLFHTRFVIEIMLGRKVAWLTQNRDDQGLTLGESLLTYGWVSALGVGAAVATWFYVPDSFWWFMPLFAGWMAAVPLAWLTSHEGISTRAMKWRIFATPEEIEMPEVLKGLNQTRPVTNFPTAPWVQALISPFGLALHVALLRKRRPGSEEPLPEFDALHDKLLKSGPESLTDPERIKLLTNTDGLTRLHEELWSMRDGELPASLKPVLAQDLEPRLVYRCVSRQAALADAAAMAESEVEAAATAKEDSDTKDLDKLGAEPAGAT